MIWYCDPVRYHPPIDHSAVSQWQPISTAPQDGTSVIVATDAGPVGEAFFCREWCWQDGDVMVAKPTHWQPLPQHPVLAMRAP